MKKLLLSTCCIISLVPAYAQCPEIIQQPSGDTYCAGSAITLSVVATGNISAYQWFRFNDPLPGQTQPVLEIADATSADSDYYRCEVYADDCEPVTSGAVMVTVLDGPSITVQPVGGDFCVDEMIYLSVTATGAGLTYQWYKDGSPIGGGEPYWVILPAYSSDAGSYWCEVSGQCAPPAVSSVAAVTVECLGVADATEGGLRVYPVPVTDLLYLEAGSTGDFVSVSLADMQGRECGTWNGNGLQELSIDVSRIASGMYLLRVETAGRTESRRIVIR